MRTEQLHSNIKVSSEIFTSSGELVYFDEDTRELKFGNPAEIVSNLRFAEIYPQAGDDRRGFVLFLASRNQALTFMQPVQPTSNWPPDKADSVGSLYVARPIERGLVKLESGSLCLTAEADGRVILSSTQRISQQAFLVSDSLIRDKKSYLFGLLPAGAQREIGKISINPRVRARVSYNSPAKKILIYGYPAWSHGRVYYDLSVHFFQFGYILDILDWQQSHSEYMSELLEFYDLILTSPDGIANLLDKYNVPAARIMLVLHSEAEADLLIGSRGVSIFEEFAAYGVVSDYLFAVSMIKGIIRSPTVVSLGINYKEFRQEVRPELTTVGYASSMSLTHRGVEWKRGHLAETAVEAAGLEFCVAGSTDRQKSFIDMPDFYRDVGAVVVSSLSESGPLPVMEAAAAGRLVIGTPVGHFPQCVSRGAGILAPMDPVRFTDFTSKELRYYKDNPGAYVQKCLQAQVAAEAFDWQTKLPDWLEFFAFAFEAAANKLLDRRSLDAADVQLEELSKTVAIARRLAAVNLETYISLARSYLNSGFRERALIVALLGLRDFLTLGPSPVRSPDQYEANLLDVLEIASNHHSRPVWSYGKAVCDWLALEPSVEEWVRNNARRNLRWYSVEAMSLFPSAFISTFDLPTVPGFYAGNWSICRYNNGYAIAVRYSNAILSENSFDYDAPKTGAISKIYFGKLSVQFKLVDWSEIQEPSDFPAAGSTKYLGFEDPRIYVFDAELFCLCTVCQLNEYAIGQMVLSKIQFDPNGEVRFADWRVVSDTENLQWEKNWMPYSGEARFGFVYSVGPTKIVDAFGSSVLLHDVGEAFKNYKGGSPLVSFDGGWLALVHEWEWFENNRIYFHRFIWFDADFKMRKVTGRFFFKAASVEFAAGLCWCFEGEWIAASFAVRDRESCLMTLPACEIRAGLLTVEEWRHRGWRATWILSSQLI